MTKIKIEIYDDIVTVINKIKNINDTGVELIIPEGSVLFDNILNLKLLEKEAERLGKILHLNTSDAAGILLIKMINEEQEDEFVSRDFDLENEPSVELPKKRGIPLPIKVRVPKFRLPKFSKKKPLLVIIVFVGILGVVGYQLFWAVPKAEVRISVSSQPLTKSVQVKVIKDGESSSQNKTLKGHSIETLISKTSSIKTTGKKQIGERAKGEIKIFNKTSEEKEFKKGEVLIYDEDDNELRYKTKDDVTVPARTEDPVTLVITPGDKTVEVEAEEIGEKYNIDEGENLKFDDFDKDDYSAKSNEDFKGGKSETIKIVSEEDKTTLSSQLYEEIISTAEDSLKNKVVGERVYIKGSISSSITNELFNAEVDEESEELELTQELTASGLAYSKRDLDKLLEELLEEFIPEGFELSSQDKEINVEILGATDGTILTNAEADLQITIKAFVIPEVETEEIRDKLLGKSLEEAEKILGGIKNIKTYELEVSPNVPFLQKIPNNKNNIEVKIERE